MRRVAVIAGQGELPLQMARYVASANAMPVVFAVSGQADADYSDFETHEIALGSIGRTRDLMVEAGCRELVMIGKIQRPPFSKLKPDTAALGLLAKVVGKGDDALLRVLSSYFAEAGITTISNDEFMPSAVMLAGVMAGQISDAATLDISVGMAVLDALGHHDVGQGVVVQDGRVLAVEAAEGTDVMLERVEGLIDPDGPEAVFVKLPKSGQDGRLDQPVVGMATLNRAASSGIKVMALGAGGVLVAGEQSALWDRATEIGVAVVGI